jgi:hypothetical protein
MKKLLFYLIILFSTFILIGNGLAAEIAWLQVQHREYGTGKSINRLNFGLVDEETNVRLAWCTYRASGASRKS